MRESLKRMDDTVVSKSRLVMVGENKNFSGSRNVGRHKEKRADNKEKGRQKDLRTVMGKEKILVLRLQILIYDISVHVERYGRFATCTSTRSDKENLRNVGLYGAMRKIYEMLVHVG